MRSRFVVPGMVRLALTEGNYIHIKRQLNVGEERRAYARMVKTMLVGQAAEIDPELVGKTRIAEYVLGWEGPGFVMPDGTPVEFSEAALMDLDAETFNEIAEAIVKHEAAEAAKRDAEKNAAGGVIASGQISPSANT